jgi:outer membrane protein insertion porin family
MFRRIFLLLSVLGLLFTSLSAATTVSEIDIIMHHMQESFDADAMSKRLKTQENAPFSQSIFNDDIKNLASEYEKIDPQIKYNDDGVHIILEIWPKPIIKKISWEGNFKTKKHRLEKELEVNINDIFDRSDFNNKVIELKKYLLKEGFFEADVNYEASQIPDTNEVVITINVDEGPMGKVGNICFLGVDKKEKDELLDLMITEEYNILVSWATHEGIIQKEAIEHDELVMISFLQNKGYADTEVTISILPNPRKSNRVLVKIDVNKGPKYYFNKVTFSGNKIFSDKEIQHIIPIKDGDVFSPEQVRFVVRNIMQLYGKKGYIDAFVNNDMELLADENYYDLNFTIEEGKQYRVGMIKIFGNTSTQQPVILHETLVIPGETFNTIKLEKTEERIRNIGYFSDVTVYAAKANDKEAGHNFRDIHIEVKETGTGSFNFFFGASSLKSIYGGFEMTELNFNYKGLPKLFKDGIYALRGGGEAARLRLNVGEKEQTYLLSWTKPYFLDTQWTIGFDVERDINKMQSDDYEVKNLTTGLYASYNINDFLRFGCHYRLENNQIAISGTASDMLKEEAKNNGIISAAGVSLNYDSTNHPIAPSKGLRSSLRTEYAGLGGKFRFWSIGYTNTAYQSLWKSGTLKGRFDVNFIRPLGTTKYETIPLGERFYMGGDTSVRGFRPYMLGPKFDNGTDDPRGGISSMLCSLEFQQRLMSRLAIFTFADAGQLSEKQFHVNFGNFKYTAGGGARVTIINNIPLALGFGFPLGDYDRRYTKRFFFSIGANF